MKEAVKTDKAPGAIGPYSQGVKAGGFVFVSGQLPLHVPSGTLEMDDIKKATRYCLENVKAIVEEAGSSMDKIVKALVFLKDMNDFSDMNEVYGSFFKENPPARSCIEVAKLPKGVRIEIEVIAQL
ncbi:MAG: RidA family protein [Oscillospiraceae bacterium]|nr:RidA family protein [Oscillospiraceae bacterium]